MTLLSLFTDFLGFLPQKQEMSKNNAEHTHVPSSATKNGKIIISLSNKGLAITYSYSSTLSRKEVIDNEDRWASILLELVPLIVQNKAAAILVRNPDNDFQFPKTDAKIQKFKTGNTTYQVARSRCWDKEDILDIICLLEFDLGQLWIQLLNDDQINESIDPDDLFTYVEDMERESDVTHGHLQCVGLENDGKSLTWLNCNLIENEELPYFHGKFMDIFTSYGISNKHGNDGRTGVHFSLNVNELQYLFQEFKGGISNHNLPNGKCCSEYLLKDIGRNGQECKTAE